MEHYYVKKLIGGTVFYFVPGTTRQRSWRGKNARLKIPFDELEQCVYDPEVRELFERGYLFIEDKECRVMLDLESGENENKLVYEEPQIKQLLYVDSFEAFKAKLEKLAEGSLEIMLQTAIQSGKQLTFEKSDFLRNKFHIDIEAIQRAKREEANNKEG